MKLFKYGDFELEITKAAVDNFAEFLAGFPSWFYLWGFVLTCLLTLCFIISIKVIKILYLRSKTLFLGDDFGVPSLFFDGDDRYRFFCVQGDFTGEINAFGGTVILNNIPPNDDGIVSIVNASLVIIRDTVNNIDIKNSKSLIFEKNSNFNGDADVSFVEFNNNVMLETGSLSADKVCYKKRSWYHWFSRGNGKPEYGDDFVFTVDFAGQKFVRSSKTNLINENDISKNEVVAPVVFSKILEEPDEELIEGEIFEKSNNDDKVDKLDDLDGIDLSEIKDFDIDKLQDEVGGAQDGATKIVGNG